MSVSLLLMERLSETANDVMVANLSGQYRVGFPSARSQPWQRTTSAYGGFKSGDFHVTTDNMPVSQMRHFYESSLGRRVVEDYAGLTTWEGEIVQMELTLRGVTHRRSLGLETFQNRCKVMYTDYISGGTVETDWAADTTSSGIWGGSEFVDVVGSGYVGASASALRDRRLEMFAWPSSRPVGGLGREAGTEAGEDSLRVYCAGYHLSMNRRYRETDVAATDASTQVTTLANASEFVSAKRIETNALSVPISAAGIPTRLWDGIAEIAQMGDDSSPPNRWVAGVYEDRGLVYEQAAMTVAYYWRGGQLLNRCGGRVPAPLIRPDILVEIADLPFDVTPPGGNVWDKGDTVWIEEVEFTAPDLYRLVPFGGTFELLGKS